MERPKKSGAVAGLPDDPLVEILYCVLVKDLHRSKCVSKGWRDLIADPLHRKKLPQTLQGFFPSYPGESFNRKGRSFMNLFGVSPPPFDPSLPLLKKLPSIQKIFLRGSAMGSSFLTTTTLFAISVVSCSTPPQSNGRPCPVSTLRRISIADRGTSFWTSTRLSPPTSSWLSSVRWREVVRSALLLLRNRVVEAQTD
jgi:hypothetical protein